MFFLGKNMKRGRRNRREIRKNKEQKRRLRGKNVNIYYLCSPGREKI
jgi:hypothetical protein